MYLETKFKIHLAKKKAIFNGSVSLVCCSTKPITELSANLTGPLPFGTHFQNRFPDPV